MVNKSVIEIDVRDEAFKEFAALFGKYRTDLAALPGAWDKLDKAIKSTKNPITQLSAIGKTMSEEFKKAATFQDKLRVATLGAGKAFGAIAKSAGSAAKSIKGITLNLFKWASLSSFFTGILGGAGLFGLDRLGKAQGDQRREAQGLGVTTGELSASKISFGRAFDVESTLARVAAAKNDPTQWGTLGALGQRPQDFQGKSSADLQEKLLLSVKDLVDRGGVNYQQVAKARGADQFFSAEDLTRIKSMKREEVEQLVASYHARKALLDQDEASLRKWQAFTESLSLAGQRIENVLGDKLVRLAEPIGRLSAAFTDAVAKLLDTGKIDKWINLLADDIKRFADWLGGDEADAAMRKFLDALDDIGGALYAFGGAIGKILHLLPGVGEKTLKYTQQKQLDSLEELAPDLEKKLRVQLENPSFAHNEKLNKEIAEELAKASAGPDAERVNAIVQALRGGAATAAVRTDHGEAFVRELRGKNPATNRFSDLEKQNSLPPNLLESVEKQESNSGKNKNDSSVGAQGPFQFMPATWSQYGRGGDVHDESRAAEAAAKLYAYLLKKYKGDVAKSLAAYNWGEGNVDNYGLKNAPRETREYVAKIMADMQRRNGADQPAQVTSVAQAAPSVGRAAPPQNVNISVTVPAGADVHQTINGMAPG
jgi:hypothetical protein